MDVRKYLTDSGVDFELIRHEQAFTAQEVAAVEHVSGHLFAKTVVVKGGGAFHLLVLPASRHVDMAKAGALAGAELEMASEDEMKQIFADCDIGAEPPFGSQYDVRTFVDPSLADVDYIVFRAGTHEQTVKMKCDDYLALEKPTVGSFAIGED